MEMRFAYGDVLKQPHTAIHGRKTWNAAALKHAIAPNLQKKVARTQQVKDHAFIHSELDMETVINIKKVWNGHKVSFCLNKFYLTSFWIVKRNFSLPTLVDCVWGNFTCQACNVTCDAGHKVCTRTKAIEARNGGKDCEGAETSIKDCSNKPCPGIK